MSRIPGVLLSLLAVSSLSAQTVLFSHYGFTGPGIEGWVVEAGPASEGQVFVGPYPDPVGPTDAFVINDASSAPGATWRYREPLSPDALAVAQSVGWTLRVEVRVHASSDPVDFATAAEVVTGARRHLLRFGSDAAGNALVRLDDGPTVTAAGSGYHLYELVFDPGTATADLFVDGVERISDGVGLVDATDPRVAWGSLEDVSVGRGNWSLVEWVVATDCANGNVDAGEACDDGNLDVGDGCDSACAFEPGWQCTSDPFVCTEICNDGLIVGGETCEDGNQTGGDGCGPTCETEGPGSVIAQSSFDSTILTGLYPSGERLGWDLTSLGDLDGDGHADLAANAARHVWYYDENREIQYRWYLGSVWILFLDGQGQVIGTQRITEGEGGFGGPLNEWDQLGYTTEALGDLDGDGVVDLLVAAHGDNAAAENAGAVYVLFLNPDGTVKAQQKITTGAGGFTGALAEHDGFGIGAAAIGDVDGDGVTDVAVGAYQDDEAGFVAGAVYVLFLRSDGTVREHTEIRYAPFGGAVGDTSSHKNFGRELCGIGDLDGDGIPDLAAGVPFESDQGTQRGAVWILFLNADGTVRERVRINDEHGGFDGVLEDNDFFGFAVENLGDIDDDGVTDLAVGATYADIAGDGRGSLWILFLNTDGTVKDEVLVAHERGGFLGPLENSDLFGEGLAAGDFDGDGAVELAVGAIGGGAGFFMGEVWMLDLVAGPAVCGNGALDPGEECDGGDSCSDRCRRKQTLSLSGWAEGGTLVVTIDGVAVEIETTAGDDPQDVAAAIATALAAFAELDVAWLGDTVTVDAAIRLQSSTDAGLADCAVTSAPSVVGGGTNVCPEATVGLTTQAYDAYRWLYDGLPIGGATGASYLASLGGPYRVTVTDPAGCKSTTGSTTVTLKFCETTEVSPSQAVFPLRLAKTPVSATGYAVRFQESEGAAGYHLYAGTLGSYHDHGSTPGNVCDAATRIVEPGELETDVALPAGNAYFLVSAFGAGFEGPAGEGVDPGESVCLP